MTSRNTGSPADIGDRHRHLLALALLAIGVGFGASAAGHPLGESAEIYLDWIQVGGTAIAVLMLVPIFGWKLRNRSADLRHLYFSPEGFVAETMRKAQKTSWEATFVVVILLTVLDQTLARLGLPPEFYLEGIVALMTGVFGVTFFVLNRDDRSDGPEEMEGVAGA
jgi:hypothetical protein